MPTPIKRDRTIVPEDAAPKKIIIKPITIKGEKQRPQLDSTRQRSKTTYKALSPERSFLRKIVKSGSDL